MKNYVKRKISKLILVKFFNKGILRGSPSWFSLGVFLLFVKLISTSGQRYKKNKYFSSQIKLGESIFFHQRSNEIQK